MRTEEMLRRLRSAREDLRSRRRRAATIIEHELDSRSVRVAAWLYRRTDGRIARLYRRRVLVLTTTGRRSGVPRTVVLQCFPDGSDLVVVAANSGLASHPAWYLNLLADPIVHVELDDRVFEARAEELTPAEAVDFWPRVLAAAPDYARYPQRTDREIPLVRLVGSEAPERPGVRVDASRRVATAEGAEHDPGSGL